MTAVRFQAHSRASRPTRSSAGGFLAEPAGEAARGSTVMRRGLAAVDQADLELATRRFAAKRVRDPRRRGGLALMPEPRP